MAIDFNEIKQQVPEERLKVLEQVIEDLKKTIATKQKEIQQAEQDIKTAQELLIKADQEQRILEQVRTPETKKQETIEEKTQTAPPKQEQKLENILSNPVTKPEQLQQIAQRPIAELYSELNRINEKERQTGIETQQDREAIYAIRRGIYEKKKDVQEGSYKPTEKAMHLLSAAEQRADSMYNNASSSYKQG